MAEASVVEEMIEPASPMDIEPGEKKRPFSTKQIVGLVLGIAVGVAVYFAPIAGIAAEAQTQLALTLFALVFWACGVLPPAATAAVYMALLLLLGAAGPDVVFSGWTSPSGNLWLIICSFLVAAGIEASGLARRIAYMLCSVSFVKDFKTLVVAIALMELVFSLIVPSAYARAFMILTVIWEVCRANDFNRRDTIVLGFICFAYVVPTSLVFLTAETALNTIALDFAGAQANWLEWFFRMGIPNLVLTVLLTLAIIVIFKPTGPTAINNQVSKDFLAALQKPSGREMRMVVWLVIMIAFWLSCTVLNIDLTWGTLFLTCAMFVPGIGVLDAKSLEAVPADTLIFVTCAMAVGAVGAATGMNEWLADAILPASFPDNVFLILLFVAALSMVVHMVVGSVTASMMVVIPLVLAFNARMGFGISEYVIVMVAFEILMGHFILSIHQAPIAVGMASAGYTDQDVAKLGIPLTVIIFVQVIILIGWWFVIGLL